MTMTTSALLEVRHGLGAQYHNNVSSKSTMSKIDRPVRYGGIRTNRSCQSHSSFPEGKMFFSRGMDQIRYINIQPKTIGLSTRLW